MTNKPIDIDPNLHTHNLISTGKPKRGKAIVRVTISHIQLCQTPSWATNPSAGRHMEAFKAWGELIYNAINSLW